MTSARDAVPFALEPRANTLGSKRRAPAARVCATHALDRFVLLVALAAAGLSSPVHVIAAAPEDEPRSEREESAPDPQRAAIIESLTSHLKRADALELAVPDFPAGKEWFNSPPLSFAKELRGKIVVLDFWTYCCINCIHVLPELARLEEKYAGQPVAFVGVHSAKFENERVSENIRQAVLRYDIRHPVINDDEMELWRRIGVQAWPTIAVVGPRGNMLLMASGEGNGDLLDAFISVALSYYPASAFRHEPVPVRLERDREPHESPLRFPGKLAVDPEGGRLYISDSNHHRIVVTEPGGRCVDVIGSGRVGLDDGPFEKATFHRLQGLAYDRGVLWVADTENHALRRVDLASRTVTTVAGNGTQGNDRTGGGSGREQLLSTPWDVLARDQRVFIAMAGTHQIWTYDPKTGITANWSGTGAERNLNSADPLRAAWAQPSGLSIGAGSLFVADSESSSIRAIDLESGATRAIAGGNDSRPEDLFSFGDTDGRGDEARFQHPLGVLWLESKARVLVADTYNHRLKLVDPKTREAVAWAGTGESGYRDGPRDEARFDEPSGFALAPDRKSVFVADTNNHRVRIVDLETGAVSTLDVRDVPPPEPPLPARSSRLADLPGTPLVSIEPITVHAGQSGHLVLELSLPEGYHYTPLAESRFQVFDAPASEEAPLIFEEASAAGALGAERIEIPFRAVEQSAKETVRVEALAYFCKDEGACRLGAVLFEIPVTVREEETTGEGEKAPAESEATVHLRHRFSDLSSGLGVFDLSPAKGEREGAEATEK